MAERNYRRDDNIRQTGRYAYIDGSTVRNRKREKPREDRNSRDAENGRVPKQDATVHVHCRCICVTLSFLELQEWSWSFHASTIFRNRH